MKTKLNSKDFFLLICLALLTIFILSSRASAQDSLKKAPLSTVKIKISKDDNGTKTDYDTTFTTSKPMNSKELNESITKWERHWNRLDDRMKDLDKRMKRFNIEINDLDLPDSSMMDSIRKITDKVIIMGNCKGLPRILSEDDPDGFEYNFETPEPPEPPAIPGQHREFRNHFEFCNPPMPPRFREFGNDEGGLIPLLRGIPLDRVKNFSIKEKRHGTRIIIDVDRAPVFNCPKSCQETIIIAPPRGTPQNGKVHRIEKRVIIKDENSKKDE
ncbi:MAG: hypothetical protein NTX61_10300 [Bacteroidetes bacterium]|nr:hypothetical protein [Bacteroidota bacterium]